MALGGPFGGKGLVDRLVKFARRVVADVQQRFGLRLRGGGGERQDQRRQRPMTTFTGQRVMVGAVAMRIGSMGTQPGTE